MGKKGVIRLLMERCKNNTPQTRRIIGVSNYLFAMNSKGSISLEDR